MLGKYLKTFWREKGKFYHEVEGNNNQEYMNSKG